jgi:type I restriction enzyme, R subunit
VGLTSDNFAFLDSHDALLVKLAGQAERYFADDPSTYIIELRQFTEVLSQRAAAYVAVCSRFMDALERWGLDVTGAEGEAGAVNREERQWVHEGS